MNTTNENSPTTSEQQAIEAYHLSRRMFCIYNDQVILAKKGLSYSHGEWFLSMGWQVNDELINNTVRGFIDHKGDVYFYTGNNFEVCEQDERKFFSKLKILADEAAIATTANVFGGMIKSAPGTEWPAKKAYGTVGTLLQKQEC